MVGDHPDVIHGCMEGSKEDNKVLKLVWIFPHKWECLHAHTKVEGVDGVHLLDVLRRILRSLEQFLHCLILCNGLIDGCVILDSGFSGRSCTSC